MSDEKTSSSEEEPQENRELLEDLKVAEQRFRMAAEAASDLIFEWDASSDEMTWYGDIESALGYPSGSIPGNITGWLGLIHEEDRAHMEAAVEHHRESDEPIRYEYRVKHADGSWRIWLDRARPVYNPQSGAILKWIGACTDVTKKREEDRANIQAKEKWERTFDAVPDLICIIDADHRITRMNRTMAERFGTSAEALTGRHCYEVVHGTENPPSNCPHNRTMTDHKPHGDEVHEALLEGDFHVTTTPLFSGDDEFEGSVHVARDITARKRAEEAKIKLERQVLHNQKMESLGVMAGGIAHDFNNLLMGISASAEFGLLEVERNTVLYPVFFEINEATKRAAELTGQMLAYAGQGRYWVRLVDANDVIRGMQQLLEAVVPKKSSLVIDLLEEPAYVKADVFQLKQVIINLVTNASESLGDDDGVLTLATKKREIEEDMNWAEGDVLDDGEYVAISVSDTGCGMNEDTMRRAFEPFYSTKFTGRGLGLSAVLGIVRGHSGGVLVSSELNAGSTFNIHLPAVGRGNKLRPSMPVKVVHRENATAVLVVDDEAPVMRALARLIHSLGYDVIQAPDGVEAVEMHKEHMREIACILLDLSMPRMDGEEALRSIRENDPDVPIIICSGFDESEAMRRFSSRDISGFLKKPYSFQDLKEMLKRVIPS